MTGRSGNYQDIVEFMSDDHRVLTARRRSRATFGNFFRSSGGRRGRVRYSPVSLARCSVATRYARVTVTSCKQIGVGEDVFGDPN
ncbi:MAG TPA: hypothetical protein VFZ73_04900 [Gemmatimonadaceae bacterium]